MRIYPLLFLAMLIACDSKLTDEQRRAMKEQYEMHKIRKVTEVEITEAAYAKGRRIVARLDSLMTDSVQRDSLMKTFDVTVHFVVPNAKNIDDMERQMIEAYMQSPELTANDNIQKIRKAGVETDTILYTKPSITKLPDGRDQVNGFWNIWLSKKQLIVDMFRK